MARNYTQDLSPEDDSEKNIPIEPRPARSIRDFRPSAARVKLQTPPSPRIAETHIDYEQERPRRSRRGVWIATGIALIVFVGAAAFILYPSTTITVIPHTHVITFDASNPLTAYPSATAAAGTISYTVISQMFEDSAVVQANGTEHAEEKATGTITISNATPKEVRLIKNTRFQNSTGLIFRIPASVTVPAMKGAAPGASSVTVFADQTGPKYNIASDTFTLPGLKSSPEFSKVIAKSTTQFSGGFSGDRPAVSPAVLESSTAEVRGRLNEKTQELGRTAPDGSLTFPGLATVTFETLPATSEAGGGVRIHERATVTIPVFSADRFAQSVAQAVSANAEGQAIAIRFSNDVKGQSVGQLNAVDLGKQTITFTLNGRGQLAWTIDEGALSKALAGKSEMVFQSVIQGFPSVDEARARITPFWQHAFPKEAGAIKVTIEQPAGQF